MDIIFPHHYIHSLMTYFVAIISILLGAFAQYFLKLGISTVSQVSDFKWDIFQKIILSSNIWCGMICYGLSLLFWFYVLAHLELSKAYPMVSLGYVVAIFLGYFFLNEPINMLKGIGIILIIIGVIFISKS